VPWLDLTDGALELVAELRAIRAQRALMADVRSPS
jgi:hypothetical protein